jgi:cytochrome b561
MRWLASGRGRATAIVSGLNIIVFGPSGVPLPPTLTIYPAFVAHGILRRSLSASSSCMHVLAALYHQFIRADGLLGRMLFGRRV